MQKANGKLKLCGWKESCFDNRKETHGHAFGILCDNAGERYMIPMVTNTFV